MKREFIQELKQGHFSEEFTAKKDSFGAFWDFCRTVPLFSEKRLAVLWDSEKLEASEKEKLLEKLDGFFSSSIVVFESEESHVRKDSFLKQLSEKTKTQVFNPVYEREIGAWLEGRAKKKGKTLDRQAAVVLTERIGRDLASLDMAVEGLAVYVGSVERISAVDAQNLLGKPVQEDIFSLLEHLVNKDLAAALKLVNGLWNEGARAQEVLGVLIGQWDRLRKVSVYAGQRRPGEFIASALKIHPYFLNQWLRQAERVSSGEYVRVFGELLDCDRAVKTGQINDRFAVEQLLVKLCGNVRN